MYEYMQYRPIKIGPYTTSKYEITDLIKSWIVISLAFTVADLGLKINITFFSTLVISAIIVGTAFIMHELAHKIAAQRYGCFAEFRSDNKMLFFGLMISFLGVIFFAPGAVLIAGPVGKRRNGIISAAGPMTNFMLAIVFIILMVYTKSDPSNIFSYGYQINTWLGLFNMIPFSIIDGRKIYDWSKAAYFGMLALGLALFLGWPIVRMMITKTI